MEIKYKNSEMNLIGIIIISILCIGLGVLYINMKEVEYASTIVLIAVVPSLYMNYSRLKKQGNRLLEYLDYRRLLTIALWIVTIVFLCTIILKIRFEMILGGTLILIGIAILLSKVLPKKDKDDGEYPSGLIITNETGLKIPGYKLIQWHDIRDVIEYKDSGYDTIGILVSKESDYKLNYSIMETLFSGKRRRLISIQKRRIIEDKYVTAADLVDEIRKNIER
ncbi:hypothetical protein [Oceanirhabdus sp. W0125-5]|uniref:hypothetical protein n=1 Tax=Oceanirhabdus sp. W0125-5 TaxID=2999116 RepID=UPI0022F2AD88|nr:hypothetical protein [Oceanirhabdus sp. W0125-5]WBW96473.1 hypothetical protein OW730_22675 [Oceanirhabdus sp. W0125-5]